MLTVIVGPSSMGDHKLPGTVIGSVGVHYSSADASASSELPSPLPNSLAIRRSNIFRPSDERWKTSRLHSSSLSPVPYIFIMFLHTIYPAAATARMCKSTITMTSFQLRAPLIKDHP